MSDVILKARTSTDANVADSLAEITSTQLGDKRSLDSNVTASALPSGAATAANQVTLIGLLPASLGQKAMVASFAVVLASDQTPISTKEIPDATATFAPTNSTTTVYASSLIVKASAGKLFSISGHNEKNAPQFIQLHNAASLPADGGVPVVIFRVSGNTSFFIEWTKFGRFFSTGIVVCNSSTGPTKTIGAADCWFDVQYA